MDDYYYTYDDDMYDGGVTFAHDKEFYENEGYENKVNVKDRIARLERAKKEGDSGDVSPPQPPPMEHSPPRQPPIEHSRSPPIDHSPPRPLPIDHSPPRPTTSIQYTADVKKPPDVRHTHNTYVIRDYRDDPAYVRLYDWGIGYIPSYYPYMRRKQLEESLAYALNREILLHRPMHEVKKIILSLLDSEMNKDKSPYIQEQPKKPTKKKTSKKTSKKKAIKKISKKKTSKKKSKKK
jgi:hypothetical protein